jgi:glycosyltransferase involved in cell wall biosynthesis
MKSEKKPPSNRFTVHFHGEYQALHGTKYILEAAKLLPDVEFRLVGGGRELEARKQQAKELNLTNVTFIPPVPFYQIPNFIADSSVCLGILGETQKTRLVIPFKIYETLAMGKPIITSDTPAVRELLTHKENIYLCQAANGPSLAQAIQDLKNDPSLRERIAANGQQIFQRNCSPRIIGKEIYRLADQLLEKK